MKEVVSPQNAHTNEVGCDRVCPVFTKIFTCSYTLDVLLLTSLSASKSCSAIALHQLLISSSSSSPASPRIPTFTFSYIPLCLCPSVPPFPLLLPHPRLAPSLSHFFATFLSLPSIANGLRTSSHWPCAQWRCRCRPRQRRYLPSGHGHDPCPESVDQGRVSLLFSIGTLARTRRC